MVVNGLVDFSLIEQASKVGFYTGGGQYTIGDALFTTSTESAVRGYMQVLDDGRAPVVLPHAVHRPALLCNGGTAGDALTGKVTKSAEKREPIRE